MSRAIADVQLCRLRPAVNAQEDDDVALAALYLGLRRGELLGLPRLDIDTERKTVTVRHPLLRAAG